jgi:hypothetical protein
MGGLLEIDRVMTSICCRIPEGLAFEPVATRFTDYSAQEMKGEAEEEISVGDDERYGWAEARPISPAYPLDTQVIAIDSTSSILGSLTDGLVGVVRASVVFKPADKTSHMLERYGPYLVAITNQNKDQLYRSTYRTVYGKEPDARAPDCVKTLDRIRNFLERYIQLEIAKQQRDSIILVDGSLIGGTVADPKHVMETIIIESSANGNSIVALSKSTGLTLQRTQRSKLSVLEDIPGPCYVGGVRNHISQNRDRYLGQIYVAKLTPMGEPFRVDIPDRSPLLHAEVFSRVAGLAGDYGYPEELKLAHMTCVLSSVEFMELQSAAIMLHGLTIREKLRSRLFPI